MHEALGIYTHDVHRRWGSVFWRSWARAHAPAHAGRQSVIRGRLPVRHWATERAGILHHGPPPAYAHGREAFGGQAWPQVYPRVVRGAGRHARRQAPQACV